MDIHHVNFICNMCVASLNMAILILVSFAGLGYLAFYIAGKVKMFDEKGVSSRIVELDDGAAS